jgi:predicted deacetylase
MVLRRQNAKISEGTNRLLVSIHDVSPRYEAQVDQLAELLGNILGESRFAMLVVPNHWDSAPLANAPDFCRRLRNWSDAGVEMFAHGWFHRDQSIHTGLASFKAGTMTAGEGEFLGLSAEVAAERMARSKALIEDVIGREVAGFIAPAWLYGPGSRAALRLSGFALAEDHMRVWQPSTDEVLARGPVITWASRSRLRQFSSLTFSALARHTLHRLPTVRIAVHPGDTTAPALMESIRRTLAAFAARRPAGRYKDLFDLRAPQPFITKP